MEDSSTPWSELEDIVYNENQYLIIGKARLGGSCKLLLAALNQRLRRPTSSLYPGCRTFGPDSVKEPLDPRGT